MPDNPVTSKVQFFKVTVPVFLMFLYVPLLLANVTLVNINFALLLIALVVLLVNFKPVILVSLLIVNITPLRIAFIITSPFVVMFWNRQSEMITVDVIHLRLKLVQEK